MTRPYEWEDAHDEWVVRVSSHDELGDDDRGPHASTYCCGRVECIASAGRWVEAVMGRPGYLVVALPSRSEGASA